MSTDPSEPRGCTHFRLRQLVRRVSRLYDAELAGAGLKGTQYTLLSQVVARGPTAPSALARAMGMDASTLTRNLRPLLEQGLLVQGPGADARSRQVDVTDAGRARHAQARARWKRAQEALNERLGRAEVAALHVVLDRALARMDETAGDD